ncbi:MAG: SBBP repeat-containing protein [Chitinophagales bacterium]|nr:SBBP repeat-containing protein [Chitinophagales bacterium]
MRQIYFTILFAIVNISVKAGSIDLFASPFSFSGFVENQGQIRDQYGITNSDVKYLYSNGLFNLQLRSNGFSYEIFKEDRIAMPHPEAGISDKDHDIYKPAQRSVLSSNRIDVIFEHANPSPIIIAEENSDTYFNYFISPAYNNGIRQVQAFNRISYKDIYPGIDLVFTANSNFELEYFFVVHPKAKASLIKMQYKGASAIALDKNNNLSAKSLTGFIRETNLFCYLGESKKHVFAKRRIHNRELSFEVPSFIDNTLIIDPNIIWGSYYGGNGNEGINTEITVDHGGKPIIAGTTSSTSLIASTGAYQNNFQGVLDICVAKFKTDGNLGWATYFGGSEQDIGYSITSDTSNNIYVAGNTTSDGLATDGAYMTHRAGQGDGILIKFNGSGMLLWSTYYGGSSPDQGRKVCVDNYGHVFMAGYCNSDEGIATPGTYQETYGGSGDAYVAMFTTKGVLRWGTYFSGAGQDRAHAVTADGKGAVYIEGTCESSSGIATNGAHQTTFGGATDAFLAKFDTSNGHLFWATYYGGEAEDHGRGVVCDAEGNVYITGFTGSKNNIATAGAYQQLLNLDGTPGGFDALLAKFSTDGKRIWGSYYGGEGNDTFYGMAIDSNSNIYIAGSTRSAEGIATPNAIQPAIDDAYNSDAALAKFDKNGNLLMGTYWGEESSDGFYDISTDTEGFVFADGHTCGALPVTPGVYQLQNNGECDYAVYKIYCGDNCYDVNEPNETRSSAALITATTATDSWGYSANIASSEDHDWFKVKIKSDYTNLKITLADITRTYTIKLYNDQGIIIDSSQFNGLNPQQVIFNNDQTGTVFIQIAHDNQQFDPDNCYRLLVNKSSTPFTFQKEKYNQWCSNCNIIDFTITPNPAGKYLNIFFTSQSPPRGAITLYDMVNKPVFTKQVRVEEGQAMYQIILPSLPAGYYICEWKEDETVIRKKVMINQ